jgi:hypothetical protein
VQLSDLQVEGPTLEEVYFAIASAATAPAAASR